MSAVDTLTGGIRRLNSKDPISDLDIESRDVMCKSRVRATAHAGTFLSNSIAMSMLARKKEYLSKCPENLVPETAKEWLMLQPFIPPTGGPSTLFEDIMNPLETFARERKKLMSLIRSSSHTTFKGNRANRAKGSVLSHIYNRGQNTTPTYPNKMIHSHQNHSNLGQCKWYRGKHNRTSRCNVN